MPEVENDRISEKTTEGSWRARMNGYWPTQAPKGYIMTCHRRIGITGKSDGKVPLKQYSLTYKLEGR
jgi:hypothetical protein